jgi:hypothetical protein
MTIIALLGGLGGGFLFCLMADPHFTEGFRRGLEGKTAFPEERRR